MAPHSEVSWAAVDDAKLPWVEKVAVIAILALSCAGCPSTLQAPLLVHFKSLKYLGEQRVNILARGFAIQGKDDPAKFGYYVYLVFSPRATSAERQLAAQAFIDHAIADTTTTDENYLKETALLLAPIRIAPSPSPCATAPETARQLVACYDNTRASRIVTAVEKVHDRLPAVALVAYPTPIEGGTSVDPARVFVTDACGSESDVRVKFDKIEAAAEGKPDGQLRRFIESMGTWFLTRRTNACP